jgi:hypothetical protein
MYCKTIIIKIFLKHLIYSIILYNRQKSFHVNACSHFRQNSKIIKAPWNVFVSDNNKIVLK